MTPDEALALVNEANRGTVWPRFDIKRFIERTLGPGRHITERTAEYDPLLDYRMVSRFFDLSSVWRPADRAAFARADYS